MSNQEVLVIKLKTFNTIKKEVESLERSLKLLNIGEFSLYKTITLFDNDILEWNNWKDFNIAIYKWWYWCVASNSVQKYPFTREMYIKIINDLNTIYWGEKVNWPYKWKFVNIVWNIS